MRAMFKKLLSPFFASDASEGKALPPNAPLTTFGEHEGSLISDDGLDVLATADRVYRSEHKRRAALLGAEVARRLDAGHEHVLIEAIPPGDEDFVPADRLLMSDAGDPLQFGPPIEEVRMGLPLDTQVVRLRPGESYPVEAGAVISHPAGLIIHVEHVDGRKVVIHPVLT